MFTGIVQGVGRVDCVAEVVKAAEAAEVAKAAAAAEATEKSGTTALRITIGELATDLQLGASVAVNGTCLTAVEIDGDTVRFDLIQETREQTNLGELRRGSAVNIERSYRVGDEVGGHILSGHTSTTVEVVHRLAAAGRCVLTIAVPEQWMRYLMPKGFVALNGASLTIQNCDRAKRIFTVSLIPETLARTTFDAVRMGDRLNLEVDGQTQAIVDTVRAVLPALLTEQRQGG